MFPFDKTEITWKRKLWKRLLLISRTRMSLQILFVVNEVLALVAEQPVGRLHFLQMIFIWMFDQRPSLVAVKIAKVARVLGVFLVGRFSDGPAQMVSHRRQIGKEQRAIRTLDPVMFDFIRMLQICVLVILRVVEKRHRTKVALRLTVWRTSILRPLDSVLDLLSLRVQADFLVWDEAPFTLELPVAVWASDPVDVQLLAVLLGQVGRQVRLANQGEGTVGAFEAFLVLVRLLRRAVVAADVSVNFESVFVRVESFALRAGDPAGGFELILVLEMRVVQVLDLCPGVDLKVLTIVPI